MRSKRSSQTGEVFSEPVQNQIGLPLRILVVDNDPFTYHLTAEVLIRQGYEVNAAEDGAAGWEELQLNSYNLLITEHSLPRLTGVDLVKKLRAARMALPVVMAAGTLPTKEFTRYPRLKPAATLLKPFSPDELLATVRIVLHANEGFREPIAPLPNWQIQPLTVT